MTSKRTIVGSTAVLLAVAVGFLFAEEPKPTRKPVDEMSIADVMQEAHKKPSQLLKKVATGKATAGDKQRLKEIYDALAKATPPEGDAASWQEKTQLLVKAAESAVAGTEGASQQLFKAANCAACHEAHK